MSDAWITVSRRWARCETMKSNLPMKPLGEIVRLAISRVHQGPMSPSGQTRPSPVTTVTSAPGKKQKFPIFIQKSIHRMSDIGGEADVDSAFPHFRFVPLGDIRDPWATPTIARCHLQMRFTQANPLRAGHRRSAPFILSGRSVKFDDIIIRIPDKDENCPIW